MTARNEEAVEARPEHLYAPAIEAERRGWYEIADLVRSLRPAELLTPGYYRDPVVDGP